MANTQDQIAQLIQIAKTDGHLDHKEVLLIYGIAHKNGIQKFQMDEIIRKSEGKVYPRSVSREENIRFFYQALILTTVDHHISEQEIELVEKIGRELSLDPERVKKAIEYVVEHKATDLDEQEISNLLQ
jgi:uncharacterized tellurite resistance protein B-like protein